MWGVWELPFCYLQVLPPESSPSSKAHKVGIGKECLERQGNTEAQRPSGSGEAASPTSGSRTEIAKFCSRNLPYPRNTPMRRRRGTEMATSSWPRNRDEVSPLMRREAELGDVFTN